MTKKVSYILIKSWIRDENLSGYPAIKPHLTKEKTEAWENDNLHKITKIVQN